MNIDYGLGMAGVGVLAVLIIIFQVIIGLALYVLFAFSLYTMASKRNIDNPWLAFIPLANFYVLGKIIGPYNVLKFEIKPPEILLIVAAVVYFGFLYIPVIGFLVANAALIVLLYGLYTLYWRMDKDKALFYTLLSAVLPVLAVPIIFFILKDK